MFENISLNIKNITGDTGTFFSSVFYNDTVLAFIFGIILTLFTLSMLLTHNPKYIPVILRHSTAEGFEKIAKRGKNGTYTESYSSYVRAHAQIRVLLVVAFLSLGTVVATFILMAK